MSCFSKVGAAKALSREVARMAKRFRVQTFIIGTLLLVPMLLAACGPTAATGNNSGPKQGGSIIDAVQEETGTLMPAQSTETFADLVLASIWASPTYSCYNNGAFGLCPGLLTEVPSGSNNGIQIGTNSETVTFHLRSGLKYSDGQPLTSADFKFTIGVLSDPTYKDKQGFPASEISGVDTPDPLTVVIHVNTVDASFLAVGFNDPLIFTPLPMHHYQGMTAAQIAADFQPSVTSGPFTVKERVAGDHITVVRNPNYYQAGKPYLDQITFKVFQDATTIVNALQAGQVDTGYFMPVTSAQTLKNIPGYSLWHINTSPNWEALYFNFSNPILADINVREALVWSFDPNTEIQNIESGYATATCDDGEGFFAHEPGLVQNGLCPYGPNQTAQVSQSAAGQVLDQDGWTMGSDGYRHKNGKTLELRISTTAGRQYRLDSEQLLQAAWKQIGIKIDVVNFPSKTFFGPILFPSDAKYAHSNDQWDIAEFENSLSGDPDTHVIWDSDQLPPAGGQNLTYYNSPAVDQLEAQQRHTADQNTRAQIFHQIHVQILKDIPTFYLYSPLDLSEYRNTLHNYMPDSVGPAETWNVWDWYLSQ
jgi:peptide/nickel transport system substrate-binding protein